MMQLFFFFLSISLHFVQSIPLEDLSANQINDDCDSRNSLECHKIGKPLKLDPPAGYDSPADLLAYFQATANQNSDIAQLIDLNYYLNTSLTHDANRIYALKISDNVNVDEDEPNFLFVGNHHSRELITPQIARNTSEQFIALYRSGNSDVVSVINNNQIYIIWTLNPDGLDYVWEFDDMWRKNRRNNGGSFGVDLNRNYPPGWDSSCGGSTAPASDTYRGPTAGSEPETRTMIAFQRERNFAKILDWHSYARDTRPGYGDCGERDARMGTLWNNVGTLLAGEMDGYVLGESCCMGGDIHNGFDQQGSMAVLIETGTAFQPSETLMREELRRVWPGTLWYSLIPIAITGHVRDQNGNPLEAGFSITGLSYAYDEPSNWRSHPLHGRYHLWLPSGTFSVTVSRAGCGSSVQQVTSDPLNSSAQYDFVLNC